MRNFIKGKAPYTILLSCKVMTTLTQMNIVFFEKYASNVFAILVEHGIVYIRTKVRRRSNVYHTHDSFAMSTSDKAKRDGLLSI